jgi:hypothetical protein
MNKIPKANIHHDRQANDLRAAVKVLEGVCFDHEDRLRKRPARLKSVSSDKTSIDDTEPLYPSQVGLL